VYAAPVDKEKASDHRIVDACQTISNHAGVFERMLQSMMRRVEARIESNGGYFEHLLQMYSFSYSHKLMGVFFGGLCGTHAQHLSAHLGYTLYSFK
jgi:hypothetical protein